MGVVFIRHHHVAFNHFLFHHLAAFRLVIGPQKVAKRRVKVASVDDDRLRTPRDCTVQLKMKFFTEMIDGHRLLLTMSRSEEPLDGCYELERLAGFCSGLTL